MAELTYKGFKLQDVSIEFKVEMDKDAFEQLLDRFRLRCPEFCQRTGTCMVQCVGDDPHKSDFGPFHVFPQHDHTSK